MVLVARKSSVNAFLLTTANSSVRMACAGQMSLARDQSLVIVVQNMAIGK